MIYTGGHCNCFSFFFFVADVVYYCWLLARCTVSSVCNV